ncbi:MAG: YlxM family DNA-binding protein [Lachnospiraceae bacterium]|nr:YlxM family DNA-binding protein [Lachnospiraceae bacterium]
MEKIVEQGLLYDFYGELLTEHQKEVYEAAVYRDMSLSEIAEEQGISRQGVHDLIKRCDKILEDYEAKLHLVSRFELIKKRISGIHGLTAIEDKPGAGELQKRIREISRLADEILEEL